VADLLLDARDPKRRRPSASVRAVQTATTLSGLRGAQRDRDQPWRRASIAEHARSISMRPSHLRERLAPDGEHGVGGDSASRSARAWSR